MRPVTPCVGVWIETKNPTDARDLGLSHPAWVCGLKLSFLMNTIIALTSHPAWVCGLKRALRAKIPERNASHPAWVCGLKLKGLKIAGNLISHTLRGCVD